MTRSGRTGESEAATADIPTAEEALARLDMPLGEAMEQYLIRVMAAGLVVREVTVDQPNWTYSSAMQATDQGDTLTVAQLSERFGPGLFATVLLSG